MTVVMTKALGLTGQKKPFVTAANGLVIGPYSISRGDIVLATSNKQSRDINLLQRMAIVYSRVGGGELAAFQVNGELLELILGEWTDDVSK